MAMKGVKRWKLVFCQRLFNFLLNFPASGMENLVEQAALRRASSMCMNWLDSKRIIHCRFCPNTGELRRHLDYMLCPGHYEIVKAKPSENGKIEVKA